jgi:hypothetical protein
MRKGSPRGKYDNPYISKPTDGSNLVVAFGGASVALGASKPPLKPTPAPEESPHASPQASEVGGEAAAASKPKRERAHPQMPMAWYPSPLALSPPRELGTPIQPRNSKGGHVKMNKDPVSVIGKVYPNAPKTSAPGRSAGGTASYGGPRPGDLEGEGIDKPRQWSRAAMAAWTDAEEIRKYD